MATIAFKGTPVHTSGELPAKGNKAPAFKLTAGDLSEKGLSDFAGKLKVVNIVPSLDTPVCAMSARRFNVEVTKQPDTVLLNVSADLPFASARFCASEGLDHVVSLSTFRSPSFGDAWGVRMVDGPLAGLMARAVVVLDADDRVIYTEQVPEIAQEPSYDAAMTALRGVAAAR
jgi:thioredoxin-dependent peroxiredoxin